MKPVVIAPIVALALAAGGAGAYLWLTSGGSTEEIVAQPTPTPTSEPNGAAVPTATPTPTAEPTAIIPADWATYRDPELGFSFSHPAGLEVRDVSPEPSGSSIPADWPLRVLEFRPAGGNPLIAVSVYQNPSGLTPTEWAQKFTACHFDKPFEVRSIALDGASGITCVAEAVNQMFSMSAILGRDGRVFYLDTGLSDSDFAALLNAFRFSP